jgi:DNA-binding CsgD family transcriptional regulator
MIQTNAVSADLEATVAQVFETEPVPILVSRVHACPDRHRYRWNREFDQLLREGYRDGPDSKQSAIDQICLWTGWPRQACWDRARALHLTIGVTSQGRKPWTPAEIVQLETLRRRTPVAKLAEQMGRTPRSVREKLKRLRKQIGVDNRPESEDEGYTITEVAEAIGRSARTLYRWVSEGRLPASPNPFTGELCVEEDEFWRFITLNYQDVLVHKVSRDYLEWLCCELLPLARPRIEQKGGRKRRAAVSGVLPQVSRPAPETSPASADSCAANCS